jgi:hypothetical protein
VGRPRAHRGLALGHVIVERPAFRALRLAVRVSLTGAEYDGGAVRPSGLVGYLTPHLDLLYGLLPKS